MITIDATIVKLEETIFENLRILHAESLDKKSKVTLDIPSVVEEKLKERGRLISEGSQLKIMIIKDENVSEDLDIEGVGEVFRIISSNDTKTYYISLGGLMFKLECKKEADPELKLYEKVTIGLKLE
ncbi:MAG: DNA-directed RNA polymerase subunit G [Candidatus Baldrarchaeia archaeon]